MAKQNVGGDVWGSPDTRPCFYKIVWISNKHNLQIPPEFNKHITSEESDRATLRSPCGIWEVKVVHDEGDIYFVEGWKEFVTHHSLGKAEFLVFKYNGDMSFDVVIYDKNGCARNYPSVGTSHQESASSFTSSFPFFKHEIKDTNVGRKCKLLIPKAFTEKHLPMSKQTMILRNSEEKPWLISIFVTSSDHLALSGGWKAFSDANSIKKGDVCIFELFEQDVMQVHMYLDDV